MDCTYMDRTYTVRIDRRTHELVAQFAARSGLSRSEVIREALQSLVNRSAPVRQGSVYDALRDLIGCYRSGRGNLSRRTGEGFRRLLKRRARGLRPPAGDQK
jgi:hypothetical protein